MELVGGLGVAGGLGGDLGAVLLDVVRGDVGVELADGAEADVAHDGVAELRGKGAEVGGGGGIVAAADDLGEGLSAEAGDVGGVMAAVGAGDGLAADDVEDAGGHGVAMAEGIVAGVLVEQRGEQPGGEIGAVGLIEEAAPGVGPEAGDAFAEGGMRVQAFGGEGRKTEEEEGGVVKGLVGGDVEVVLPTGWMDLGAGGDGAEVGHEAEDAVGLLELEGDGVAVLVDVDGPVLGGVTARAGRLREGCVGGLGALAAVEGQLRGVAVLNHREREARGGRGETEMIEGEWRGRSGRSGGLVQSRSAGRGGRRARREER